MKGQCVAAFGCPHPRFSLTGEGDLLAAEARLVADRGASAALALQAVAHGDARWFALNRKVKLPATAGGASNGHGPAPWLSIWRSVGWTSKRGDAPDFVEVGEAGIAVADAMRRQRRVQLVG